MSDENRKDDAPPAAASTGPGSDAKPRRKHPGRIENLKPWRKGQSGNPAGRKPMLADIRLKYLENVDALLAALLLAAHKGLKDRNPTAGVAAAKEFMDRVTGKAPQPIVGEDGGAPINVNAPALVEALKRIVGDKGG